MTSLTPSSLSWLIQSNVLSEPVSPWETAEIARGMLMFEEIGDRRLRMQSKLEVEVDYGEDFLSIATIVCHGKDQFPSQIEYVTTVTLGISSGRGLLTHG